MGENRLLFNIKDTEHYEYPQLSMFCDEKNGFKVDYLEEQYNVNSENAIYIHIPFCKTFCVFCNYYKEKSYKNDAKIELFTDTIIKELIYYAEKVPDMYKKIKAIHFGGGTPTCIGTKNLEKIVNVIREKFYILDSCLISIESHVRDLCTENNVKELKQIGFNRISFGIQSFSVDLRKKYGLVPLEMIEKSIDIINKYGITDFNVDLMYNFPEQTVEDVIKDIEKSFSMGCNCIDLYSLNVFPGTRMEKLLKKRGNYKKYLDTNVRNQYKKIYEYISNNQEYNLVMSNTISKKTSKPNEYLKIHLGANRYEGGYIIGVGPSARGYLAGYLYKNIVNLEEYIKEVNLMGNARLMDRCISQEEKENRTMVMFPNFTYILKKNIKSNEHIDEVLEKLITDNLIKEKEDMYYIDPEDCFWAGNISSLFYSNNQKNKMIETAIMNRKYKLNMYNQDKMQILD